MTRLTVTKAMGIDLMATGQQLKKLRQENSLTQEELSELFELGGYSASRVIISMWENGRKLPRLQHVVFLAELYRCSLDELVVSHRRSREAKDCGQPVVLSQPNSYHFLDERMPYARLFFRILPPGNPKNAGC